MTLGSLSVESRPREASQISLVQLAAKNSDHQEMVLEKMRASSYDCFFVQLKDMQVIVAGKNEDWKSALQSNQKATPLHVLLPLSLDVHLYKCLVSNDPNLPRIKVEGKLPQIALTLLGKKDFDFAKKKKMIILLFFQIKSYWKLFE